MTSIFRETSCLLAWAALILALLPRTAAAYYNGMPAEQVFGQINFSQVQANQGVSASSRTLRFPSQVHVGDYGGTERLFVLDRENNRALVYDLPASTANAAASVVIGQPDFTSVTSNRGGSPSSTTLNLASRGGIAGDGTNLFISDLGNNRVLIYLNIAAKIAAFPGTEIAADFVIGQPDFTSSSANNGGRSASSISEPQALAAVKAGAATKLLVVDRSNYRVLIYNDIPSANFAAADLVIGQADFTGRVAAVTQSVMRSPSGVGSDGTKVAVAEWGPSNRVLLWDTFPTSNGQAADRVIGQSSFVDNTANAFGSDDSRSIQDAASAFYSGGRLFVGVDNPSGRVLIYNQWPTETFAAPADIVIGRKGFAGQVQAQTINIAPKYYSGLFEHDSKLYVGDHENHRVLVFPDVFGVYRMTPSTVSFGPGSFEVLGDDFLAGSIMALVRAGQTDIPGTNIAFSSVTAQGRYRRITVDFDLSGAEAGGWDLVLSSGTRSASLVSAVNILPFTLSEVLPNFGYDHSVATLFLKGTNLPAGASISLTRSGQDPIVAADVVYHSSVVVQASFDLRKQARGLWNVAVASGANNVTLADSFVVGRFPFGNVIIEATKSMSGAADDILTVTVSNNGLTNSAVIVPAGAIPGSLTIDVSIGAILAPPSPPPGFVFFKTPVEMTPSGMEFSRTISLEIPYEDDDLERMGISDPARLVGKTYNVGAGAWEDVTTTANTSSRKIQLATDHFSAFSVMAPAATDFSQVNVYPNPFTPALGHSQVRITGLPPGSEVKLFSLAGDLVRTLSDGGGGNVEWDGKNSAGMAAASGAYVAVVNSPIGRTRRIIAVER